MNAFHQGEQAVQRRVGSLERLSEIGDRVIRSAMPDQHRGFFEQLPFMLLGALDAEGQPWASVLAGPPGFMTTPSDTELHIGAALPAGDPLQPSLHDGAAVGLLGIQPHTRRRNRMNGRVHGLAADGFDVTVSQSFGNCPKYIQPRELVWRDAAPSPADPVRRARLDAPMRALIAQADTFFIASAHPAAADADGEARHGVDVSHRGGPPGFVRIDGDDRLTVPDYLGNMFFNTIGNLLVESRAGLLFIDWTRGDLLHLSVQAELVWDGPELDGYPGAQRLLSLRVTEALWRPAVWPLRVVD